MSITLSALQQQRRDTAANWTSANPTLLAGEIGVETDTGLLKIGDGSTAWTSLDYLPLSFEGYAANGIYNPAANQVALATNSTGRLFIDSSGNVGVGTSAPTALLEIKSTSPIIKVTDSDASGTPGCQISGADGDLALEADSGNDKAFSKIRFTIDGSEVAQFESNGNLGIGTTAPLNSSGYKTLTIGDDSSVAGQLALNNGTGNRVFIFHDSSNNLYIYNGGAAQLFYTDGTERMRIDSSGNVGIDFTPKSLHTNVTSSLNVGSSSLFQRTKDSYFSSNFYYNSSDIGKSIASGYAPIYAQDVTNGAHVWYSTTNASAGDETVSISERMRIDSSGSVGIGTTSPSTGISGSAQGLSVAHSNVAFLSIENTAVSGRRYTLYANDSGSLVTYDEDGNAERMRIDSSGRVGIGTTSPSSPLHVKNAGSTACRLILENSGSGSDDSTQIWSQNNDLAFNANDTERMRIDSSGRVGIGTSSPTGLLDVKGDGDLSGTAYEYNYVTDAGIRVTGNESAIDIVSSDAGGHAGSLLIRGANKGFGIINVAEDDILQINSFTANANDFYIHDTAGGSLDSHVRIAGFRKAGGITFNGDTAQANALDDYEEGTWTPTVGGTSTYSTQQGSYIKIGKLVHVTFYITISSIGTGSTYVLSGLPFTAANYTGGGPLAYWAGLASNYTYISAYIYGTTNLTLYGSTAATATLATANFLTTGSAVQGSLVYRAA